MIDFASFGFENVDKVVKTFSYHQEAGVGDFANERFTAPASPFSIDVSHPYRSSTPNER